MTATTTTCPTSSSDFGDDNDDSSDDERKLSILCNKFVHIERARERERLAMSMIATARNK
jgi:hypothetical protein